MTKHGKKLIIVSACAAMLYGVCIGQGISQQEVKAELALAQSQSEALRAELESAQSDLQLEIEKTAGLSAILGETRYDLQNALNVINTTRQELDVANITIADLKSTEYELVYIGDFKFTYYCNEARNHICGYGLGITASGKPTEVGWTIAVDPTVIPLGSIVYVEGLGFREAQDTGGGVKGSHIDILLNTHSECFEQTKISGGVWILVKKNS